MILDRMIAPSYGRRRYQRLFRKLHAISLAGMNVGEGDVKCSGELALLKLLAGAGDLRLVVDVGANVGAYATHAAQLLPRADIIAFEPAADAFASLRRATDPYPRVRCERLALSSHAGESTLHHVAGNSGLSSLVERDLARLSLPAGSTEDVTCTTLDEYATAHGWRTIDLLKLDVEGHELEVLRGAHQLLQSGRIDRIQFEFGGANVDSRTYLRDFVEMLSPRYALFRVLRDGVAALDYSERAEIFVTTNFLAVARDVMPPPYT